MPLNTLRLNHQASTHPNERIVFIKPVQRPAAEQADVDLADTFLRAIAAQCLPIMKKHYLSVTTLEEYEPNPEFIGRNFNNGEVIQLVLRTRSGGWVPFNMVQMVLMHELAHNLQMNHGKQFWVERNKFSNEMKELWGKGYTGEGFWGSGRNLRDLQAVAGNKTVPSQELADLQVCGGTFRSRGRKRKRGGGGQPDLTWKEKRDRRIEKKFGKNGQPLGEDEHSRQMLEVGKKGGVGGKPRVANSKRGRELRAAAALARFGTNNVEEEKVEDGTETSDNDYDDVDIKGEDARDLNGQRLLDSMGFGMVRVCGAEDKDHDQHVKQEMEELAGLDSETSLPTKPEPRSPQTSRPAGAPGLDLATRTLAGEAKKEHKPMYDIPEHRGSPTPPLSPLPASPINASRHCLSVTARASISFPSGSDRSASRSRSVNSVPTPSVSRDAEAAAMSVNCQICSMANDRFAPTCAACANVLDPRKDPRHWRCHGEACQDSQYVNAGDCGICGVCGSRK